MPKIISTPNDKPRFGYLIFGIPIIIGILVNPGGLNQQIADTKEINIVQNSTQANTKSLRKNSSVTKNAEIVMTEKNFFAFLNGINDDPNIFTLIALIKFKNIICPLKFQ